MIGIIKKIIWLIVLLWLALFIYRNFIAQDIKPFFDKYKDNVAF